MKIVAHSDHAAVAIRQEMIEQARAAAYSIDYDSYDYDFGQSTGQSVALDDYDFGSYQN
jgi:DNA-directed RNA polymerase subunit beta'